MLRILLHRAPSAAILAFAGWTLLAQICVALGANLVALEIAAAVAVVATGLWARRRRRVVAHPAQGPDLSATDAGGTRAELLRFAFALLCAVGIVVAHRASGQIGVLATGGAALLLVGTIWRGREREPHATPAAGEPRSFVAAVALLALALASSVLVLVAHNPDPDDAFYVNVAAQVASSPTAPLLVEDGIFGIEGMPIQLPVYRAHSIELLVGAVAHLTGLEPILVAHLGLVALAGFLLPLAAARLLHRILPGHAVLGAALTVVVLLACGEGELGPGHFALLRVHQGKGVLLALALPMLFDAVLAYAHESTRGHWLRLFAVQVAAVGLTSSALLLFPCMAAVTLLVSGWSWRGRLRALLAGTAASAHALLVLAWLGPPMAAQVKLMAALEIDKSTASTYATIASDTLRRALGESPWSAILLVLVLCAWAVPRRPAAGRALAGSTLVVFGLLLQPPVARWIAERLLAPDVYFRALWMVPWGIAAAVTLLAPLRWLPAAPRLRIAGTAVWAAVALGLPLLSTSTTVLDEAAGTRIDRPGPKVPPMEYEAARWLAENVPPGSQVLAALDVAPWVSTFRSMPHPVYSRMIYHRYLQLGLPSEDVYQRRTLAGFVSFRGPHLDRTGILCPNAERRDLQGIVLRWYGERTAAQIEELAACGFRRAGQNDRYEVWVRERTAASPH